MSPGISQAVVCLQRCAFSSRTSLLLGVMLGKKKIVCSPEGLWAQRLCEQFWSVPFCSSSSLQSMINSQYGVVLLPNFPRIHEKENKNKIK